MSLPGGLTPRELGDLAVQMVMMDAGELVTLALEHPERVNAVALMAATAVGMIEPGGDGE